MKIGFIGLGVMGSPMAGHLMAAGHSIFTCLNRSPLPRILEGASIVANPAKVAEASDIVITMLPDTPDVEAVLLGPTGVVSGLAAGKIVIDMSSISPVATRSLAQGVRSKGAEFLDAPVSGGEVGAKAATLTIMVGGDEATFHRVEPIFRALGRNITWIGAEPGSGQVCKIANQIIVGMNIEAVAEALLFASRAGVDPGRVQSALMGGFAASRVLEVHGPRMIERRFEPGFRMRLHRKDLRLALEATQALDLPLPGATLVLNQLTSCIAAGQGDHDHSGLVQALERATGHVLSDTSEGALE